MIRKTLTTLALSITIVLTLFVGSASAGVTCQTDAAAEIAGATVNGPRQGWDPPVWTYDMPDLNMSVDVQAYTQPDAATKAQTWLQGQVDDACAAAAPPAAPPPGNNTPDPAPAPAAPSPQAQTQASSIIASATVTYLGNSWGPTPLYEVDLRPAMNWTIDVAANSPEEARTAVAAMVAAQLDANSPPPQTQQQTVVVPSGASTPAAMPLTAAAVMPSVSDPTLAPAAAAILFPDRSAGYLIRAGFGSGGALATG